ncbi:MAG: hypothetical protein ACTSX0_13840 [Promethearchaeota archaeon]
MKKSRKITITIWSHKSEYEKLVKEIEELLSKYESPLIIRLDEKSSLQ